MIRVASFYAGIGGIDKALEQTGHMQVVWANEWDKYACRTYRANMGSHLHEGSIDDVRYWDVPSIDMIVAGFPCQPFSIAGHRQGFEDVRGAHFFKLLRFVDNLMPSMILLENVKNFANHDGGRTQLVVIRELRSRGYHIHWEVLNTSDYGIPQNRERWFLMAFRSIDDWGKFKFAPPVPLTLQVADILDDTVDDKYIYTDRYPMYERLLEGVVEEGVVYQWRRKYVRANKSGVCPTLTANMGAGGHNVPIVLRNGVIRKLTPLECFRLQGYPHICLPDTVSDTQLYKQAGNSVSLPVVRGIGESLYEEI